MRAEPFTVQLGRQNGTDLVDHFCTYVSHLKLDSGEFWEVEDFQIEVVKPILYGTKETWTIIPEGNAKHLHVYTEVPTPTGWTTMLDLHVGCEVLGVGGRSTRVSWAGPVETGHDCYRLGFGDGAEIVASGEHLWSVIDSQPEGKRNVRKTRDMFIRQLIVPRGSDEPFPRWLVPSAGEQYDGGKCRVIERIERVPSVPVKCIQVEAEDSLYLVGRTHIPTHNTTLMAGVALYMCDYSVRPWIPIGASSRDQAQILAQQAYQMINDSPGMKFDPETGKGRFRIFEGYRMIKPVRSDHPGPGVRGIRVHAADVDTGDGIIPYPIAFVDEAHRHPDMGLYRMWKGKLNKRKAQIALISTAGEPGGEFEEYRDSIRDKAVDRVINGAHVHSEGRNGRMVMNEWVVQNVEDVSNPEKVKEANPLSTITVEELQEDFEAPTTDLGDYRRLKCNISTRNSQAAVNEIEWQGMYVNVEIPHGEHIDLGCDVAWKLDTFAIQPLWTHMATPLGDDYEDDEDDERNEEEGDELAALFRKTFRLLSSPQILVPPRDGSTIHPDTVKVAFESFMTDWVVDAVVMDMQRAEDIAAWLEDDCNVVVIDRGQGNSDAGEDYEAWMRGMRNGTLRHNGHSGLRSHVMNAIARALPGNKRRFDRPSQSRAKRKQDRRVIDCLTAAAMVNQYAETMEPGDATPLVAWR